MAKTTARTPPATLSRTEVQWLINMINRQLEDLEEILAEPEVSSLEHGIAELMRENYAHVRKKLEQTLDNGLTRIYVKQPEPHPFKRPLNCR